MRTLLLICAACAVDGLKPAARKVMLIRHAESEHNEAERNWDLRGLLLKRDHGITTAGYKQCDALQAYVELPRERFLETHSAQHAITTSQVR